MKIDNNIIDPYGYLVKNIVDHNGAINNIAINDVKEAIYSRSITLLQLVVTTVVCLCII